MDHQEEDCIAVGSTGTLLSLMGKEMEILQARRSCSLSYNNMNYKSPSAKDPNTLYASNVFGSPASPLMNPPPTSIVSSLWSDLKGLLRSPTSIYQSPHSPLIYHNNALFFKGLEINEDSGAFCNRSPSQASPRTPSSKRSYPKKGMANSQAPAQISLSPSSSKQIHPKERSAAVVPSQKKLSYPKEKLVATEAISHSKQKSSLDDGCLKQRADYPHGKSALYNYPQERLAAGAAHHPNPKSPLYHHSQERSAYANRKDTDVYQVTPTRIVKETCRKGNRPKERPLVSAAAANPNLQYPKGKAMDASNPNLQYPTYPKAKAMDAVYAMRHRLGSTTEEAKGSFTRTSRNSCSRKREERAICSMQDEYKREERGTQYPCMQKREGRECMQYWCMQRRDERGSCMQEYECWMKKPMLQDMEKGPYSTPASSPLNMSPCFKPSGRSLPPVSVVDLQCCHTPTPPSRRLSFTRLSSF